MSRTREGRDKEPQPGAQSEPIQTTGAPATDRTQTRGQSNYAAGRESRREFPRRSTSMRGRAETTAESRDLYGTGSQGGYSKQSDFSRRQSMEGRTRYTGPGPYGTRGELREGSGDVYPRDIEDRLRDRGSRYRGSRTDDRERSDRSSYPSGRTSRGLAYDREARGFETERESYDEPWESQPQSSRHGYWQDYQPARVRYEAEDRADFDEDYQERRAWGDQRQGRHYLRVSDIMTRDVTTCSPQTTLREVADNMKDDDVGSLPVVENGRLVGIITDRDIVCRALAEGLNSRATPAAAAMSEEIVTCTPDEAVHDAIRKMGEHQVRRIPVCDINGRLRGIIAMADIALEAERDRELADALEEISQPTPTRSRRV
jgi:CBS domain-containing protein